MLALCAQEAEGTMVPGQLLAAILALETLHAEVQDTMSEVLSAQMGAAGSGLDLENAALTGQQRDVEGAAHKLPDGAIRSDGLPSDNCELPGGHLRSAMLHRGNARSDRLRDGRLRSERPPGGTLRSNRLPGGNCELPSGNLHSAILHRGTVRSDGLHALLDGAH